MKIAKKILAITFLISTVAIAGIAGLTLAVATDALHDLLRKSLGDSVSREARILQNSVDMVKSDMALLAEGSASGISDEHSGPNADGLQMLADQFTAMMRKRPAYAQSQIILHGAGGQRVLQSRRSEDTVQTTIDPPRQNPSHEALLRERQGLRSPDVMFGQDQWQPKGKNGESVERKVLYFSAPVVARGGAIVGAVAVVVDFDRLVGDIGRPRDDMAFYVTDRDGHYLYRSKQESGVAAGGKTSTLVDDFRLRDRWKTWLLSDDPHVQRELPGASTVVDLHRIALSEATEGAPAEVLVVGGAASYADVEMKTAKFRTHLAFTVLGVGALMVLALAFATGYVVRPIDALTRVANRIAAGDRDVVAPTQQRDEIGVLARAMMRMAEELRKTGKNAEQAAMGRMASMIAHDLRNALSSVKMNLHILYTHHRDEGDDYSDGCEIALEQVRYMENILNDMLAFARPDSMELDWLDLGEIIKTATLTLLPDITRKSIDVRTADGHKLPTILGDRNKLLQLLQNVLDNAVQAAPEGGHVSIETRSLLHESQPAVEIKVIDDGPGIPAEIADKLFEPFFTTRARGTGLGLAIVQRIVKQHGGQIHLASAPEGGAIATIILPLTSSDFDQETATAPGGRRDG